VQVIKNSNSSQAAFSRLLRRGFMASSLCIAIVGCSGGQSRLAAPSYDPSGSAAKAMEIYDADHDGFIAGSELDKATGVKAAMKNVDKDGDGKVSEQEIADRIATWEATRLGMMTMTCEVTLNGGLLDGAIVTFVPEKFLEGIIEEAGGETSLVGMTGIRVPADKMSSPDLPPGVRLGMYQVKISKKQGDKELIPAIYNTETILGQEVAKDDPAIMNNRVQFNLRTK
jgi:hypothetical protein